jgi:menaquinone-dependent protoporphyrinogen IX oxidase
MSASRSAPMQIEATALSQASGRCDIRTLVNYDSVFGNTEKVAQAIALSLGVRASVENLRAEKILPGELKQVELPVGGSPTRGFRPTEAVSGLLSRVPVHALDGAKVAAFDTGLKADALDSAGLRFVVMTGGYAAKRMADRVRKPADT